MSLERILFLCVHNSSRSQMAEGFARLFFAGSSQVEIWSAGTEPRGVSPYAVRVMAEKSVDLSSHTSKHLNDVPAPTLVVTLCGESEETCPTFPAQVKVEHWALPDPSRAEGSDEEKLHAFRSVRDEIERRVRGLIERLSPGMFLGRADPSAFRTGLGMGSRMPDFTLPDHLGRMVNFTQARDGRRALVHFFRSTVW